jgi:hypothetical protein
MEREQGRRGIVGAVRGDRVDIRGGAVGAAASSGDLALTNGGAGAIAARRNLTITNGGGGPMIAGGDVSITNGGAQTILAAGGARLGARSFVGFVLSPRVTIEPGARVLCSTPQALAFGVTASVGALAMAWLLRRGHDRADR